MPEAEHLKGAVRAIKEGDSFREMLKSLMGMSDEELRKAYLEREIEPPNSSEDWRPNEKRFLREQV